MNGSAVFLFSVLKMRLAMAIRRRVAADGDRPAPSGGRLDAEEQRALEPALETLFSAMGLPDALGDEARVVSAARAFPAHALRLLVHFEAAGA